MDDNEGDCVRLLCLIVSRQTLFILSLRAFFVLCPSCPPSCCPGQTGTDGSTRTCTQSGHSAPSGHLIVVAEHSASSTQTDRWTDVTDLCHWLPSLAAQLTDGRCCQQVRDDMNKKK